MSDPCSVAVSVSSLTFCHILQIFAPVPTVLLPCVAASRNEETEEAIVRQQLLALIDPNQRPVNHPDIHFGLF